MLQQKASCSVLHNPYAMIHILHQSEALLYARRFSQWHVSDVLHFNGVKDENAFGE
jgi:hypothetical protein